MISFEYGWILILNWCLTIRTESTGLILGINMVFQALVMEYVGLVAFQLYDHTILVELVQAQRTAVYLVKDPTVYFEHLHGSDQAGTPSQVGRLHVSESSIKSIRALWVEMPSVSEFMSDNTDKYHQ